MDDKLQTLYEALKVNPNITGMPEDYNAFATYFQDPNKGKSLYEALKANPNIIGMPDTYESFGDKFGLNMEQPEQQEGAEEERIGYFKGLGKKLLNTGLNASGQMAISIPQGLGALANDLSTRIQFPGLRREINKRIEEGTIPVEQGNEIWKAHQAPTFNFKTGSLEQGHTYGENLADSQLNDWFKENQERLSGEINRYDQTASEYIKNKEFGKALGASTYMIAESFLPTVVAFPERRLGLGRVPLFR